MRPRPTNPPEAPITDQPNPADFSVNDKPGQYEVRIRIEGEIRRTIKADSLYWGSGSEAHDMIVNGEVAMGMIWQNRGKTIEERTNGRYKMVMNEAIAMPGAYIVPRGNPAGRDNVMKFIAQALQLIRGGREPALRVRHLPEALAAIAQGGALEGSQCERLLTAYRFLRRLENRLQMLRDAQERWKNTLNGLHTAMRMQAQVSQNLAKDESALADLVSQSQSATGALQAMQATNQLLALQAKQSIQTQQLQITQDRAASLELARQAAATERAREVRRRFLGTGTPYTPQTVNFYNN